jgi:hypothetical protein
MNTLIELRQRSKGYEPVETDDDYDAIPVTYTQRKDPHDILTDLKYEKYIDDINEHGDTQEPPLITKKKDSKLCKDFLPPLPSPSHSIRCLVPLLDSLYLKVAKENANKKPLLGDSVVGAVMMYVVTAILSAYYIYRSPHQHHRLSPRFSLKDSS